MGDAENAAERRNNFVQIGFKDEEFKAYQKAAAARGQALAAYGRDAILDKIHVDRSAGRFNENDT